MPKKSRTVAFWEFVSKPARIVGAIYAFVAFFITVEAICFPQSDGGEWIILDLLYWPASEATRITRHFLKTVLPHQILYGFPSEKYCCFDLYNGICAIAIGVAWYYLLVKCGHYLIRMSRERREVNSQR
jgi:hypothetical protein